MESDATSGRERIATDFFFNKRLFVEKLLNVFIKTGVRLLIDERPFVGTGLD